MKMPRDTIRHGGTLSTTSPTHPSTHILTEIHTHGEARFLSLQSWLLSQVCFESSPAISFLKLLPVFDLNLNLLQDGSKNS